LTLSVNTAPRILLVLGRDTSNVDQLWLESGAISEVVRLKSAAPSGYRFGSRVLGLGLDSALLALKAIATGKGRRYLAANPWIAVAARLLGATDLAITGLYATPGTRSFKLLRKFLANASVVTTVSVEAEAWNDAGGRALPVLYGNNFDYPKRSEATHDSLVIFVGGSSDRDAGMIQRLEQEVLSTDRQFHVTVIVVANDRPSVVSTTNGLVEHTGYVSSKKFGDLLSTADVAFLPLTSNGRAAGHMVTVGALESGLPVFTTEAVGMDGYVDGRFVQYLDSKETIVSQASALAASGLRERKQIIKHWQDNFSRRAYVTRVAHALTTLDEDRVADSDGNP
jgi:hypothetical protein